MLITTIQPKSVVDILESGKKFRCSKRKSYYYRKEYPDFVQAYDWLVEQMINNGIQSDNRLPVWGWYKYSKYEKTPSIRTLKVYSVQFRLRINIPDELVLLTDFNNWHNCITNLFCGSDSYVNRMMTLEDNKTWEKSKIERLKKKSWNKIFDIENSNIIQATFPYILPEYIKEIKPIL